MKETLQPKYKIFLALFILCHILSAFFATGFLHPDEHFQVLEFASFLQGKTPYEALPWEFSAQMRPLLLPYTFFGFISVLKYIGVTNPSSQVMLFQLIVGFLGAYSFLHFQTTLRKKYQLNPDYFYVLAFTTWFIPLMNVRILSGTIGASFFFLGLSFYLREDNTKNNLKAALFMGLGMNLRYHLGLLFTFLLTLRKRFWIITSIIFTITFLCNLLDLSHYIALPGIKLTNITLFNYFNENFFNDKASTFGTSPWWNYFYETQKKLLPPYSFIVIFAFLFFWIKKVKRDRLAIMSLAFFVFHSLISHKELRFIFPLTYFLPLALYYFLHSIRNKFIFLKSRILGKLSISILCLLMILGSIREIHPSFKLHRYLTSTKPEIKTLYHFGRDNPYYLAELPIYFYKYREIDLIQTSPKFIEQNKGWYFVEKEADVNLLDKTCEQKYLQNIFIRVSKKNWGLFLCE